MWLHLFLDEQLQHKLLFLQQATGQHLLGVLGNAPELSYQQVLQQNMSAAQLLETTGFVGSGSADRGFSENYKRLLDKQE